MNLFLASNKIWREKYLKESLFLKNFDIFWNKLARLSQSFAARLTKFCPPDEIRRFDSTEQVLAAIKFMTTFDLWTTFFAES